MIHSTMLVQLALLDFWAPVLCLEHSKQDMFCKLNPFLFAGEKMKYLKEQMCSVWNAMRTGSQTAHPLHGLCVHGTAAVNQKP